MSSQLVPDGVDQWSNVVRLSDDVLDVDHLFRKVVLLKACVDKIGNRIASAWAQKLSVRDFRVFRAEILRRNDGWIHTARRQISRAKASDGVLVPVVVVRTRSSSAFI